MDETTPRRQGDGRLIGRVRKERIAALIRARGFMSSADLAEAFGVSEMTVRRDLAELEERGIVQRTHGGAVAAEGAGEARAEETREPFFDERRQRNAAAKTRIAEAAARLVGPRQAVALDVGTTTYALARLLVGRDALRIVTNNLRIAALSRVGGAEIYALGGQVRPKEMSLCGPIAAEQARQLWFDVAFLGVSGLTRGGLYDYAVEETEMKHVLAERAARRVALADSSKFGARSLVRICGLDKIDVLVTEAAPPDDLDKALADAEVEVIVADQTAGR